MARAAGAAVGCIGFGQTITRSGRSPSARLVGPNSGCVPTHGTSRPKTSASAATGEVFTLETSNTR